MSKLDHDLIVDEAMRMIEADGEAGLSMRSLAAGLNVTPMALYRYFADRDALLLALVVRVSETLEFPERTSDPRADAVALALTLHDFLALHPWMIRLISTGRLASPAGMRFPRAFLTARRPQGLTTSAHSCSTAPCSPRSSAPQRSPLQRRPARPARCQTPPRSARSRA